MKRPVLLFRASLALATLSGCSREQAAPPPTPFDLIDHLDGAEVVPAAAAADASPGERLLFVEGFEDPAEVARWRVHPWRGRATGARTDVEPHAGGHAYTVTAADPDGADAELMRFVPVEPSTRYRFTGHVRADRLAPKDARIHGTYYLGEFADRDQANPHLHRELPSYDRTSPGWQRLEYVFTTQPFTRLVKIAGSLGNWGRATGSVQFDDIALSRVATPGELDRKSVV